MSFLRYWLDTLIYVLTVFAAAIVIFMVGLWLFSCIGLEGIVFIFVVLFIITVIAFVRWSNE